VRGRGALGVAIMGLAACAEPADLVLEDGRIWTGAGVEASAIAVRDGRVVAVGGAEDMEPLVGPRTERIALGGRFVAPGFLDSHTHFLDGGFELAGVQLRDAAAPAEASEDELEALATAADAMRAEGIEPVVLSGGSTPTSSRSARAPLTELRPGEYVYNDLGKLRVGACRPADLAFFVAATVVSDAVPGQVIVDVGTKALGREGSEARGYGTAPTVPGAVLTKLNEYHGYLAVPDGVARPHVGEVLAIAPNHVCPVVNLFDDMLVHEAGRPVGRWPVDARGHLS